MSKTDFLFCKRASTSWIVWERWGMKNCLCLDCIAFWPLCCFGCLFWILQWLHLVSLHYPISHDQGMHPVPLSYLGKYWRKLDFRFEDILPQNKVRSGWDTLCTERMFQWPNFFLHLKIASWAEPSFSSFWLSVVSKSQLKLTLSKSIGPVIRFAQWGKVTDMWFGTSLSKNVNLIFYHRNINSQFQCTCLVKDINIAKLM